MTPNDLTYTLRAVANQRAAVDTLTNTMNAMLQVVRDSAEFQALLIRRADLATELEKTEQTAKDAAMVAYLADGKKTRPGVTVKTFSKTAIVYDLPVARNWAKEKMPELLVLDVKKFEKYAEACREIVPLEFVKFETTSEDKAQLASDLSEFATPAEKKAE